MDVQLKRGLLEVCVLSAMRNEDSYGYKLIKDISPCIEISESTLYPILKRLESGMMVTVSSREHNGRLRKYYSITPGGRQRITDFIAEWDGVMRIYDFIKEGESHE